MQYYTGVQCNIEHHARDFLYTYLNLATLQSSGCDSSKESGQYLNKLIDLKHTNNINLSVGYIRVNCSRDLLAEREVFCLLKAPAGLPQ